MTPSTSAPASAGTSSRPGRKRPGITLTKRVWQLHSWLGLVCGLGLLVIGTTGSLLVFHDEIDAWRFPALYRTQPMAAGRLSYDALWASLRQSVPPQRIVGWSPARTADDTDAVYVTHEGEDEPRTLHFDPYTGNLRGRPYNGEHSLSGWLLRLHYTLLAGKAGTLAVGLLAVLLLVLGASGLWLYRGFWRSFFTLRWGRSARLFFSDLHKTVGISSTVFNLIVGFTGAWWNLDTLWVQWQSPATPSAPAKVVAPLDFAADGLSFDALVARAGRELPGFRPTYVNIPPTREGAITFYGTVPSRNPLRGDYGSRVTFNAADGALQQVVNIRRAGVWERVMDAFVLLHYGTFGAVFGTVAGVVVKGLWTLLGLAPGVLAVSGFLIWRARRRPR